MALNLLIYPLGKPHNLLNLVISAHPDMVSQVEVVPGISDHEAIINLLN